MLVTDDVHDKIHTMYLLCADRCHWCVSGETSINTLGPRQNGRHFADDIFKYIFLNENVWISIKISLKFVPKGPINNIPSLVQIMAWRRPGDKPLSEPMMVNLLTHICVTRPQWVNLTWNTSSYTVYIKRTLMISYSLMMHGCSFPVCTRSIYYCQYLTKADVPGAADALNHFITSQSPLLRCHTILSLVKNVINIWLIWMNTGYHTLFTWFLRLTGHLYGEFTSHRWIPRTKASDAELWCFHWSAPE